MGRPRADGLLPGTATIGQFDLHRYRTPDGLRMYDAIDPDLFTEPVDPTDPASPTYGEVARGSLARQVEAHLAQRGLRHLRRVAVERARGPGTPQEIFDALDNGIPVQHLFDNPVYIRGGDGRGRDGLCRPDPAGGGQPARAHVEGSVAAAPVTAISGVLDSRSRWDACVGLGPRYARQ